MPDPSTHILLEALTAKVFWLLFDRSHNLSLLTSGDNFHIPEPSPSCNADVTATSERILIPRNVNLLKLEAVPDLLDAF